MSRGPDNIGNALLTAIFGAILGFAAAAIWMRSSQMKQGRLFRNDAGVSASSLGSQSPPSLSSASSLASASASPLSSAPAPASPPTPAALPHRTYNVLLITIDTLRSDLGFTGYPKPITPNIDALASRSTTFDRAYSTASFTPKSLGPMQIGRYASETHRDFEHYTTFAPSNVFIAERAHDSGVRTFAAHCHRYFTFKPGLQQGFDVWDTSAMPPNMTDNDTRFSSNKLTDVALGILANPQNTGGANGRRFFGWFHYFDPHAPYVPHAGAPDFRGSDTSRAGRARAQYDEEVWFTDVHVGRLLNYIAAQPWAADTAIILTADHGEAFGEHNHWLHGRELWEPLVRVPLLVFVPGARPKRIPVRRSHIDLAPTILELLGAQAPSDGFLRGTSLMVDVAAGPTTPLAERDVYVDMPVGPFNEERHALITGASPGMKLIDFAGRRFEMYDLTHDPNELQNLAGDKAKLAPIVSRLAQLRQGLQEIPPNR